MFKHSIHIGRSGDWTLNSKLIRVGEAREKKRQGNNQGTWELKRRIRLEGAELEAYRATKNQKEQEEARSR